MLNVPQSAGQRSTLNVQRSTLNAQVEGVEGLLVIGYWLLGVGELAPIGATLHYTVNTNNR
jgi:hypothetical protein